MHSCPTPVTGRVPRISEAFLASLTAWRERWRYSRRRRRKTSSLSLYQIFPFPSLSRRQFLQAQCDPALPSPGRSSRAVAVVVTVVVVVVIVVVPCLSEWKALVLFPPLQELLLLLLTRARVGARVSRVNKRMHDGSFVGRWWVGGFQVVRFSQRWGRHCGFPWWVADERVARVRGERKRGRVGVPISFLERR